MATKRSSEIDTAVAYIRSKPKYQRFAPEGVQDTVVRAVIGHVLDRFQAERTPKSKLLYLTGFVTREFIHTNNPAESRETEALIKAIEAGISEVLRQRKRWQKKLRERKAAEASENPVTKSGQIRLI